jgi:hypothetical protein
MQFKAIGGLRTGLSEECHRRPVKAWQQSDRNHKNPGSTWRSAVAVKDAMSVASTQVIAQFTIIAQATSDKPSPVKTG